MSQETSNWLNNHTLIGYTDKRGKAWHYREDQQGDESNHYTGAVPVEDVERRLFNWEAIEVCPVAVDVHILDEDGVEHYEIKDYDRKHIVRPRGALSPDDPGGILGTFMKGYNTHQHKRWLIDEVADMVDTDTGDLGIGSAGLLQMGAVAFVQIELPESIQTPEGVEFRPYLLAAGSMNGSLSSTYKKCRTIVVCDNTMEAGLWEPGAVLKVRHTKNSIGKLKDVREVLGLLHRDSEEFATEVAKLCKTKISKPKFEQFLELIAPAPEDPENFYGASVVDKKRAELSRLWNDDERVAPWKGTAYGVVALMNTYQHHSTQVMGKATRYERNQMDTIKGKIAKSDKNTIKLLADLVG